MKTVLLDLKKISVVMNKEGGKRRVCIKLITKVNNL